MIELPRPNEHHRKLHRLVGSWVGREELAPSSFGPGGAATGRISMRADIDGLFVLEDYVEEKDGRIVFRGHGIFGWDEPQKNYTWYWIDSMGLAPAAPSRGQWEGETLTFEHSPVGDQRGRYSYEFSGQNALRFQIECSKDGGRTWTKFMEGNYQRA
jgi:hypothetical protein